MSKRRIENKIVDDDDAELVFEYVSPLPRENFRWVHEELYKEESGQFFAVGEGGPLSQYAETVDERNWKSGEDAYLLSSEEALGWLTDRRAPIGVIEKHFG